MSQNPQTLHEMPPTLAEFESWSSEQVSPLLFGKTVIFSPGGSTRWYFFEHGDYRVGYARPEQFLEYSRITVQQIIEVAHMMLSDGVQTVLVIGLTPKQMDRNPEYNQALGEAAGCIANEAARALYDRYQIGAVYRGRWEQIAAHLEAPGLIERFRDMEQQTAPHREKWLVWATEDKPIPDSLIPLVTETIQRAGQTPDRAALCQAYYGRPIHHADLFLGNNKTTIEGQIPPLLTLGDLYFTVSPSLYMDRPQWRSILYDHLFARRGHYRDYTAIDPDAMEGLRAFYQANQNAIIGLGSHHAPTQTWRPALAPPHAPGEPPEPQAAG